MAATIVDDDIAMQLCLWPVENPAALDSLRSTVGLSPIKEYLKNLPTIALCYDFQLLPELETEEFDIPVDTVLWA